MELHFLCTAIKLICVQSLLLSSARQRASPLEQFFKQLEVKLSKDKRAKVPKLSVKPRAAVEPSSDQEVEYNKVVSLPPAEVTIGSEHEVVTQVSCGTHHTVLLLQNGDVYTFGSNQYAQLGMGDTIVRGVPTKVQLPMTAVQVAAGTHHTVVLLTNGQVYTFGNFQKGSLGRHEMEASSSKSKAGPWYSNPGPVPSIGARYGRRATWIGSSGDQTFVRIDESLVNAHILSCSKVFANQKTIGLIPKDEDNAANMKCLMISRIDGSCKSFSGNDQLQFTTEAICLDPVYDILWSYCPVTHLVKCFNVVASETRNLLPVDKNLCSIFKAELAVPVKMSCNATRSHCALHILACLDTLTIARQLNFTVAEEAKEKPPTTKVYTKEDYSIVNRFESHGGGWGYSGHSIESIRFMTDTEILLGGFGLFGGRGEYYGRIKVFELGVDGGDNETDGELLAETDDIAFECAAREKSALLFEEPVPIQAHSWYVAWARIHGPSSDCGSSGQSTITTEDQVVFKFKSSKKSNNGTDVNAGQIPQILYRLPSRDNPRSVRKSEHMETAHILSPDFAGLVSPACFEALLHLLEWSVGTFHSSAMEVDGLKGDNYAAAVSDLHRLVYISNACLRIIRMFVAEIYPDGVSSKRPISETSKLAECIGETQDLLRKILAEEVRPSKVRIFLSEPPGQAESMPFEEEVLSEAHRTFRSCFHAFYPTGSLKWWCLCDLLSQMEPGMMNAVGFGRLLAAIMEAMCHPTIKLTGIMPINCEPETEAILRRQSIIMDDNTNSMARLCEMHKFPLLVGHMTFRIETTGISGSHVSFKEVLDRLLMIVALPVRQGLNKESSLYPSVLVTNTCALLSTIVSELAATATGLEMDLTTTSRPMLVTPNRFTRTSQSAYWNTGNGSPDAIAFCVDKAGIVIAGVCVYGGGGQYDFEVELLDDQSDGLNDPSHIQRWNSIELVKGTYGTDDCVNDIAEIKFEKPIPIKEGVKYAVKLRNHGPRTLNGDGGVSKVKCPDGTTFTFMSCSLSSNGSNHMRGQIPQLLYYSTPQDGESQQQSNKSLAELQARKNAIDIVSAICRVATDLLHRSNSLPAREVANILAKSHLFSSLLPLVLAYIGPVASQDPRGSVQVLSLIQEILPAVSSLSSQLFPVSLQTDIENNGGTTSQHYALVESDHPYKPATVANFKVVFPDCVKWMVLEFDPQCGTAQTEDTLQLYLPAFDNSCLSMNCKDSDGEYEKKPTYWPVLKKFSGTDNWPKQTVVLAGHEVIFSLETASDYVKDEKACFYGFKCAIVGYEWNHKPEESITQLERELSYLGGMCASSLMKREIALPPVTGEELEDDVDYVEEGARLVYNCHSSLLGKGFALSHPPTIMQALEGNLPFCWQSNERAFLKDFVSCSPGTSGGRLAKWLQPDSYLDPKQCEIVYSKEDLKSSWPAVITVLTKDQYGNLVHVSNLKVEVKAVPVDQKDTMREELKKMRRLCRPDEGNMAFGGHAPPSLETPYEVTMKDRKDIFHAISMMKSYENTLFEELRFAATRSSKTSENMLVRANNDGTYSASWTPSSTGFYDIHVCIDGFDTGEAYKIEVKDPPQGVTPPSQAQKKGSHHNRMRKFVAKYSAGLRIRTNPSLQSEQIGLVDPGGIISFINEIHNDDGVWVRLSPDSIKEYCLGGYSEAWCLQYNQHLGKTLLVPIEEPKSILDEIIKETILRKLPDYMKETSNSCKGAGVYRVVKCGSYGHNIRWRPTLKATPIGMLTLGDQISITEDVVNQDGVWVKLDSECVEQFCHIKDGEAWSLASGKDGILYLQHESEIVPSARSSSRDPFSFSTLPPEQRGFDFAGGHLGSQFPLFGQHHSMPSPFTRSASLPSHAFAFGFQGQRNVPTFGQLQSPAFGYTSSFDGSTHIPGMAKNFSVPSVMGMVDMTSRSVFQHTVGSNLPSGMASPIAMAMSPAAGSPKTSKKESNLLPPELQGVSVKELVKALGESRANGNGPTPIPSPPGTPKKTLSRSSSPRPINKHDSPGSRSPVCSGSPRNYDSPSRSRMSDSSSQTSLKEEMYSTPPDSPIPQRPLLIKEPSFDRYSASPPATPKLHRVDDNTGITTRSSSGHSLIPPAGQKNMRSATSPIIARKDSTGSGSSSPRYTSPVRAASRFASLGHTDSVKPAFNIGSSTPKEEAVRQVLSPKTSRKDRGRQLRSKRERAASPSPRELTPVSRSRSSSTSMMLDQSQDTIKEALSPSVAECLRAVFAAFLWHEGIVHDAMACASFLKFHPNLSKEMSAFAKAKKQEKTRIRHATDSSKERNKRKENININEARVRFNLEPQFIKSEIAKSETSEKPNRHEKTEKDIKFGKKLVERHKSEGNVSIPTFSQSIDSSDSQESSIFEEKETQLPPTLHHLVYFWEELSFSVIKVITHEVIYPSPALMAKVKRNDRKEKDKDKEKKVKKKKDGKLVQAKGNVFGDAMGGIFGPGGGGGGGAAVAAAAVAAGERETACELCGGSFPHPVTYHMRQSHPGCGRHAAGKGYNSNGNFCGGWAGNCGEGGFGGSSWYLLCDKCREKYLKEKKQVQKEKDKTKKIKKKTALSRQQTVVTPQDPHLILKNNAMFLLDLASASGFSLPTQGMKKYGSNRVELFLPSVIEEYGSDLNPFPLIPFQYLVQQNAQASDSAFADDFWIDDDERVFIRSGSLSIQRSAPYRPRLPTEPRHSPLARSGSLGQDTRPPLSHISPTSPSEGKQTANTKPVPKSAGTSPDSEQEQYKKTAFQRSISEIVSDDDGTNQDRNISRLLSGRRRNNSGGVGDGGMSLLKHPSAAMQKLIGSVDKSVSVGLEGERALHRPVMSFIIQRHDLEGLQLAMRRALRKAACRVFAMQALNWLLRSTTQSVCLHDLLWFFVSALMPPVDDEEEEDAEGKEKEKEKIVEQKKDQEDTPLCDHPLTDISIAGKAVHPLCLTFHTLLQTIADVMMHLPAGSSLQQMAVRCWCLKFQQIDHQFLHESHVFSNISYILSKTEEEAEDGRDNNYTTAQASYRVCSLKDVTPWIDLHASSRQAMIASLTDNSTETFWESGDEDRNKMKTITLTCQAKAVPITVYVHIDNTRDLGSKVSQITFNIGGTSDDLKKVHQVDVEPRHVGWVSCHIPSQNNHCVQLELKGSDHSLRVRQVKVLGELDGESLHLPVHRSAEHIQKNNCENETLKVFRLLTSQVFGRLISEEGLSENLDVKKLDSGDSLDGDHDLKEHMVGILFSRSKLSHLQKQVCSHIVQGIRKETVRVREEWETFLLHKTHGADENRTPDVYCFELLSMVLALSGSSVGRAYLAQQYRLLQDLFSLLHTGSPRVQRQVTAVLKRVLPEVKPQTMANILSVPSLPQAEYSIISLACQAEGSDSFDPEKPGILDVFLACISKALTVQTKVKSNLPHKGIQTVMLSECLAEQSPIRATGPRWWLRGRMTSAQANSIIILIQDMAAGHLSESWATVTKAAIAEAILGLTKLDESIRIPQTCIKTPSLWLALASLCVLDRDHVERLTSGEWISSPNGQHGQPRPTCDNHDDNCTLAIILCSDCGVNLCADCDRYLHLHRSKRSHQRQVFKEEEEAIKVDLHEGCGRTKLFWLMALADSRTLKAMVEFREGKPAAATTGPGVCRFCGTSSNTGLLAIGNVCSDTECQEHAKNACTKVLSCGHPCGGIKNEDVCLPCLHRCKASDQNRLKQDADDMCMICFTEALSAAPALQLKCGHIFHSHCSKNILAKRWVGPRITFGFSLCPICKSIVDHPVLKEMLTPIRELYDDVRRKALMRLEYEGLHKAEVVTTPGSRFYKDPAGFAMDRYAYYVCYKCTKAYYGGEARCDDQAGVGEDYDPTELVCGACSDVSRAQMCPKHGTDYLEYKCRYCCSVAVFFCFGTTHFCNACHDDFQRVTNIPKNSLPNCPAGPRGKHLDGEECPLHVQHPPTGEEFALGCGVCRNAHTF
ncbi:hypothetical protein ScPMuIL_011233 [Solemya velum]